MMLIDSHFHLTAMPEDWQPSSELVAGLAVTTQPSEWYPALQGLSKLSANWRLALGVHPWFANLEVDWLLLERLLVEHPLSVIGEVGLDGSNGCLQPSLQQVVFQKQLDLAKAYDRLLSLHCVNDHEQSYALIRKMKGIRGGIVHGFTGSLVQAQRWQALGFHIGIGVRLLNPLTDKRRQLLRSLDVSMIHLESDAPLVNSQVQLASPNDLPPFLAILAGVLAVSVEGLSQQLWMNWSQLWGLSNE